MYGTHMFSSYILLMQIDEQWHRLCNGGKDGIILSYCLVLQQLNWNSRTYCLWCIQCKTPATTTRHFWLHSTQRKWKFTYEKKIFSGDFCQEQQAVQVALSRQFPLCSLYLLVSSDYRNILRAPSSYCTVHYKYLNVQPDSSIDDDVCNWQVLLLVSKCLKYYLTKKKLILYIGFVVFF